MLFLNLKENQKSLARVFRSHSIEYLCKISRKSAHPQKRNRRWKKGVPAKIKRLQNGRQRYATPLESNGSCQFQLAFLCISNAVLVILNQSMNSYQMQCFIISNYCIFVKKNFFCIFLSLKQLILCTPSHRWWEFCSWKLKNSSICSFLVVMKIENSETAAICLFFAYFCAK